jgi:hypothetical protein
VSTLLPTKAKTTYYDGESRLERPKMADFNNNGPGDPVVQLKPKSKEGGFGGNGNLRPGPMWQPGQSGNPNGGRAHSRHKLSKSFLLALTEAFEQHGKRALEICATEDPTQFVRIVASILPREINLDVNLDATRFGGNLRDGGGRGGVPPSKDGGSSFRGGMARSC